MGSAFCSGEKLDDASDGESNPNRSCPFKLPKVSTLDCGMSDVDSAREPKVLDSYRMYATTAADSIGFDDILDSLMHASLSVLHTFENVHVL